MNNTKHTSSPTQSAAKRKAQRPGLGCSLAFVVVLVGFVVALVALGPRALNLLANPSAAAPSNLNDHTSPEKMAAQRQQEIAQLHGYGWVNKGAGIAHIPIDRAIALVAEKGLPVGGATTKTTAPNTASTSEVTSTAAPVDLAHVSFKNNVLPIFQQHCIKCHGGDNPEQGLELTSYRTVMTGSENGSVIEPGDPDKSYLVKMVVTKKMPKKGPPLSSTEINTIIAWIKAGAKDN
jgi:hypothetical protein